MTIYYDNLSIYTYLFIFNRYEATWGKFCAIYAPQICAIYSPQICGFLFWEVGFLGGDQKYK